MSVLGLYYIVYKSQIMHLLSEYMLKKPCLQEGAKHQRFEDGGVVSEFGLSRNV